jgi:hypothetical protein
MAMKTTTYRGLCALHDRHGPREFGKICQKLLALAFRAGGCPHVVERGVQGVDIDAVWAGTKYTVEIKTTRQSAIHLLPKDVLGLASRSRDGYRPLLGVLRLSPLADWLLADAGCLQAGELAIDALRPHRSECLERRLRPLFDDVLAAHAGNTLRESQRYLDRILRQQGVEVAAEQAS